MTAAASLRGPLPVPQGRPGLHRHAADRFEERIGRLPSFRGLVGAVVYGGYGTIELDIESRL
ncbi:TPA: hypothetical protein EYP44_00160 [Candidatus Bathyarchaeota archaeon]|nr:hypothetical protein [Candidatus Bathyarchaeota archaeon]